MAGQANNNKQQLKKKKLLRPNFNLSEERAPKACFVRYTFLFLIPETSSAQKEKKKNTKIKSVLLCIWNMKSTSYLKATNQMS